mgnify:CR=1 FL=1|jgi:hypothetical protein
MVNGREGPLYNVQSTTSSTANRIPMLSAVLECREGKAKHAALGWAHFDPSMHCPTEPNTIAMP